MSCQPERVTGFVDGALDGDERDAVEAHLRSCPSCQAQAAGEQAVRQCLKRLPSPAPPLGLEARLRERLHARRAVRRRTWAGVAIGFAVLALLLWGRGSASLVAWELSRDHDACYSRPRPPARVASTDAQIVSGWLAREGTSLPAVPARLGALGLRGARYCYLPDVSAAAHLYYSSADRRLSLFVVSHEVRVGNAFRTRSRDNTVALLRLGQAVIGVVGGESEDVDVAVRQLGTSLALTGSAGAVRFSVP